MYPSVRSSLKKYRVTRDASLTHLASQMLPLVSDLALVRLYTQSHIAFKYGSVHHALAASLRRYEHDWAVFVASLERSIMTV
jgi:hypothetical protein